MNALLILSTACFVTGGFLLVDATLGTRTPSVAARLVRLRDAQRHRTDGIQTRLSGSPLAGRVLGSYDELLRRTRSSKTAARFMADKAASAAALAVIVTMLHAAVTGRLPSPSTVLLLAAAGSFIPDMALRSEARRRREAIFLDLPEAVAIMRLALGAGKSLRQALELAARDCPGALGDELTRALSIARRERGSDERDALVRVARESREPTFERFAELLSAKESPYLDFLADQVRSMRADQARHLERAADRAYLAMHAPLAPLLSVLVLLVAYGFLYVLGQSI